jgi:hypothetical protein
MLLRRAAPAAALGIAVFALVAFLPPVDMLDRAVPADLRLYETFGGRMVDGEIPYDDFYVEYPPGSIPAFFVPALADGYATAFRLEMWALGAAAVALVAFVLARSGAGRLRLYGGPLAVALAPLPLRHVFFNRYDLWPAALVVVALAGFVAGRGRLGGAALGVGAAAKVFPAVLLPLAWRRSGVACVAAGLLVALPFAVLGPGGLRFTTLQQLKRPIQIESLGGSLLLLADADVVNSYGSHNIAGAAGKALAAVQLALIAAALVAVWTLFARGPRDPTRLLTAAAASVVAFVTFGKVLSPQYLIWLAPVVPLVAASVWVPAVAGFFGAAVLTQLWFPDRYGELVAGGSVAWLVLARNVVLVLLFAVLVLGLRTPRYR